MTEMSLSCTSLVLLTPEAEPVPPGDASSGKLAEELLYGPEVKCRLRLRLGFAAAFCSTAGRIFADVRQYRIGLKIVDGCIVDTEGRRLDRPSLLNCT